MAAAGKEIERRRMAQRWQKLRDAQAERFIRLAKQAVDDHQPSLAFELATEAVRENPDHEARPAIARAMFEI